tara:strand:+ start:2310 stop:3710 length:1401 start_codon:yes stop_codon:yes gene_type:complete
MSNIGSKSDPLRVAVIGSGPAGFYTFSNLLKHSDVHVELDMIDRVPTPFGLVRAGVAPDHQKYKTVTRVYDKSAQQPNFRFYGAVEYGTHLHLDDLKSHYHQVVFATGAQTDRELGIPGEHLPGSHAATDFIGWYNGHPDYSNRQFDLSQESVAIIGLGNVAIDIARLLCKTEDELKQTDMADYAIEALANSGVKRVYILGRRGPAQAAFSSPEIKEVGELVDANIQVRPEELELDDHSQKEREERRDRRVEKNLEILNSFADQGSDAEKGKTLSIRFLVSPTEIVADESGCVSELRLVRNKPVLNDWGGIGAQATDVIEALDVGLVFRSVGYQGVSLTEIPFDDNRSIIRNEKGRVISDDGEALTGLYCCGWIKRGPTGVIGTNKTDAQETVSCMMVDLQAGKILQPQQTGVGAIEELISSRQASYVSYRDWQVIDQKELDRGIKATRPRIKFTSVDDMLAELDR